MSPGGSQASAGEGVSPCNIDIGIGKSHASSGLLLGELQCGNCGTQPSLLLGDLGLQTALPRSAPREMSATDAPSPILKHHPDNSSLPPRASFPAHSSLPPSVCNAALLLKVMHASTATPVHPRFILQPCYTLLSHSPLLLCCPLPLLAPPLLCPHMTAAPSEPVAVITNRQQRCSMVQQLYLVPYQPL